MNRLFTLLLLIWCCAPCFGQWTQVGDVPFVNHHSNGFGFEGKGYIIQGEPVSNGGQDQNQLWEYDPQADTWTSLGFVPAPDRDFAIGDDMDNKYYFGFGSGKSDVWEYDPSTNVFTELPSCPCIGRAHPAFVAHKGKFYMGAGSNNGNLKDWWIFDMATQMWTKKQDIPGPARHHPYQFGIGDAIYVGGGHQTNWLKFDINTELWSNIDDFPRGRVAGSQFSFNGRGFVLTGDKVDHMPLTDDQFLMYDPAVDEWFDLPFEKSMHRWAPSSFIIDTDLYLFGGYGANGGNDRDVWKFDLSNVTCLPPQNISATNITENSAGLFWVDSPLGDADTIQWRELGTDIWNNIVDPEGAQTLEGLASCTDYEFRVNANCSNTSNFSEPFVFRTKGCGACTDVTYCDVSNEFLAEKCFINKVKINAFENESGSDGGYEEFTASNTIEVGTGESFSLEVEPTFTSSISDGNYKIWLDFNADGDFAEDELVLDKTDVVGTLMENITIPGDATLGLTRIRIALELNPILGPCNGSVFDDGEVEDYCLTLVQGNVSNLNETEEQNLLAIHPNPSTGMLWIENEANHFIQVRIYEATGKLVASELNPTSIDLTSYHNGFYLVNIENLDTQETITEKLILRK